ncbi:MAG: hypothetical protein V4632_00355 [Pseudomonadota bacterium]
MTSTPDFELLKDAYAIIDGIPAAAIALGAPRTKEGPSLGEGTVCSPEGWLALHPRFNQLGLTMQADGKALLFNDEPGTWPAITEPLARVFGLPTYTAAQLFGERSMFTGGDDSGHSDKELWQMRLRQFLQQEGQLGETPAREPASTGAPEELAEENLRNTETESDESRSIESITTGERRSVESIPENRPP